MNKSEKTNTINTSCLMEENINLNSEKLEQQNVQQRYYSELAKYREQINQTEQLAPKDNRAA